MVMGLMKDYPKVAMIRITWIFNGNPIALRRRIDNNLPCYDMSRQVVVDVAGYSDISSRSLSKQILPSNLSGRLRLKLQPCWIFWVWF